MQARSGAFPMCLPQLAAITFIWGRVGVWWAGRSVISLCEHGARLPWDRYRASKGGALAWVVRFRQFLVHRPTRLCFAGRKKAQISPACKACRPCPTVTSSSCPPSMQAIVPHHERHRASESEHLV